MIFKAFREKSNQKYINKILSAKSVIISNKKIESVGVIIEENEFSDLETLTIYFHELGIQLSKIKIIAFSEDKKKKETLPENYFSKNDFGWRGSIKNVELQSFLNTQFDALVSFYKSDAVELRMMSAASKANFKIGLSGIDDRLFDFILDVGTKDFNVFKSELKKYLTLLKKI